MPKNIETISPSEKLEIPGLTVYRDHFPADVCRALHEGILRQRDRKMLHSLIGSDAALPKPIQGALPFIEPLGNTIITKRYDVDETSGAFEWHCDPPQYAGNPLVLSTLGGRAILSVQPEGYPQFDIDCVENTVVITEGNPPHSISPPLDGKHRTFMFVGNDNTVKPVAPHLLDKYAYQYQK